MSNPSPQDAQPGPAPAEPPATHLPQQPTDSDEAPMRREPARQPDNDDREDPDLQHESPV
ncbi:hypothetical protein ACS5PN_07760 [Roseateles sp. NT4]|uniref:hypothetical protein n=1 Tax=Roseateles sp. NT4 TaxID=3453715 RepID=UPI003EEB88D0